MGCHREVPDERGNHPPTASGRASAGERPGKLRPTRGSGTGTWANPTSARCQRSVLPATCQAPRGDALPLGSFSHSVQPITEMFSNALFQLMYN